MAEVTLITGGARSGKSSFAENQAISKGVRRAYIATAPVIDEEMVARVAKHQRQRASAGWTTIEEQIKLAAAIEGCRAKYDVILVDCLTLWINNLLYEAAQKHVDFREEDMTKLCQSVERACQNFEGNIVFVINDVGSGIVPDNLLSRQFRDCSGRCSQIVAGFADHVFLICCGLPLKLK